MICALSVILDEIFEHQWSPYHRAVGGFRPQCLVLWMQTGDVYNFAGINEHIAPKPTV